MIRATHFLKPEIKTEFEIGTDLRFFKDRFSIGATYYRNEIKTFSLQ
ncbi:MAG: TonB-dependent receptor [Saprospiraceae bacterium]|nr:TonB-dependent receptor [Saprospiraceae bacterium]